MHKEASSDFVVGFFFGDVHKYGYKGCEGSYQDFEREDFENCPGVIVTSCWLASLG